MDKRTFATLFVITALGLGLRVYWILNVPTQQLYDFETFLEIASNIYRGEGHSLNGSYVSWVGPGYSYALAFFYWIVGSDDPFNAKIFNVILSTATLVMSAFVYRKWFSSDAKLITAYGLTAIFPNLIAYNNVAGTETLFLFLIVGLLLVRLYVRSGRKQAILMGVLCGLAALTKPFMLAYPAVALAMWWMQSKSVQITLMRTLFMTITMLFVLSPWTIRNYLTFDRFILISYNMGYNQIVNNNYANIHGTWMPLEAVPVPDALRDKIEYSLRDGRTIKEAYELDPLLAAHARHWMLRNPIAVSQLALLRIQQTFFNGAGDISQWAMNDWDFYDGRGISPVRNQRHMHFFEGVFDIFVNVFSATGLLFVLINLWSYVKDFFCTSKVNYWMLSSTDGMVFLHVAFFVTIVAAFEGQERYAHPVFIFLIYTLIWLCSSKTRTCSR